MIKPQPHIIPELEDWPISQFSNNKEAFIDQLNVYAYNRITEQQKLDVEEVLEKTVFLELKRTSKEKWKVDPTDEKNYWKKIRSEISAASKAENKDELLESILRRIINRYSVEIVGNFNPKTFKFARKFLTFLFKRLYNSTNRFALKNRFGTREQLLEKFDVTGPIESIRSLYSKGTVVVVPTHFSNLDSILIGYVIDAILGIPAFIYGAGLNLYNNEIVAYYMNRMGTYRVDRRKKNRVYIETLKSMNTVSLIQGVNNLFFPGGTRSRSGAIEKEVKLGLLNSVVESQRYCIRHGINQKIFIVPLVTSYPFVLDAKSLIHQYLKGFGKSKYSEAGNKTSLTRWILNFMSTSRKNEATVALNFGRPMDVFGNHLNDMGESIDEDGEVINISQYFTGIDGVETRVQREYIYTKKLGSEILSAFKKNKVVIPSNIVAFAGFRLMLYLHKEEDIFSMLKYSEKQIVLPQDLLVSSIDLLVQKLQQLNENNSIVFPDKYQLDSKDILELGLKELGVFHLNKPIIKLDNNNFGTESIKILFYYHNQLENYGLEQWFDKTFSLSISQNKI